MLEFKQTELAVTIYGTVCKLRFPTLGEVRANSVKEGDAVKIMVEFLESLGLPEAVANKMEMGHLSELIEVLTSQKKS